MERSERMKKAYEYLRFQGLAGTQEDVADHKVFSFQKYFLNILSYKRHEKTVLSCFSFLTIINVANMEVLNFVLGQTKGRVRADLPTLQ